MKENILFLHAISGCDTTSSFFRQGKLKFVKLLEKDERLQEIVKVFKKTTQHQLQLMKWEKQGSNSLQLYMVAVMTNH